MKLSELYAAVAREADTAGIKLNAAEVSRTCAILFKVLARLPTLVMLEIIAKAIKKHTAS